MCFVLAAVMLLSMTACGKKNNDTGSKGDGKGFESVSFDELKNYVFRENRVDFIDVTDSTNIFIGGDTIYASSVIYSYSDDYGVMPIAKEYNGEIALDADEEILSEEALGEEADAKKIAASSPEENAQEAIESSEEDADIDNETEDIAQEMPVEEGVAETYTVTIDAYEMNGRKKYSVSNEYDINSSVHNFLADDKGNLFFLNDYYGFDENTGSYSNKYTVACLDSEGKEKWNVTLAEETDTYEFYVSNTFLYSDGIALVTNTGVMFVDSQGNLSLKSIGTADAYSVGQIFCTRDGKCIAVVYAENGIQYYNYDINTGSLGAEPLELPSVFDNANVYASSLHDFVLGDSNGIYTYDMGDKDAVKLMDFIASDTAITGIGGIELIDDNSFYGSYYDDNEGKQIFSKFTKVDPSEITEKKIINLAGLWIDYNVRKMIVDYNKKSQTTKVIIRDYSTAAYDYNEMLDTFNNDIIKGNTPDIILMSSDMNVDNYANKGVFEDLYQYIDKDKDISREDYMTNVLELGALNGKLYYITPSFYVSTVFAKSSIVGDKPGWTMDEYKKISKEVGSRYDFGIMSKSDFISAALNYNADEYIDWATGKVSFNSPEFISLLQYTDNLPDMVDYESDDVNDYWNSYDAFYRENRAILYQTGIYSFRDVNYVEQGLFGEKATMIGFPNAGGSGTTINGNTLIAMGAKSNNKDEAWEFIRELLLDDYQDSITSGGFPIKLSSIEKCKQAAKERPFYMENGEKVYYDDTYFVSGQEITIEPMSDAKMDEVISFFSTLTNKSGYNQGVTDIVLEEAAAYFSAQKSAEDVVKVIQNRVQIYVDENR